MIRIFPSAFVFFTCTICFYCVATAQSTTEYDIVLTGGRVIDPETKLDTIKNVGIINNRIAQISSAPLKGKQTINVSGLVVAPCSRYPVAWKSGNPKYPAATALSEEISSNKPNTITPLFISPNPSSGKVRITYKADKAGNINLIIYDKSGAAVFRKNDYAVVGNNIYELNLYSLISGAYYIELNYNYDLKARQQFIISR